MTIILILIIILLIGAIISFPILLVPIAIIGGIIFFVNRKYKNLAKENPKGELTSEQKEKKEKIYNALKWCGIVIGVIAIIVFIVSVSGGSSKSSDGSWHVEAFWGTDGKRYYHTVPGK